MPKAIVTLREVKNKDTGIDISIPNFTASRNLFGSSFEFHIVVVTNLRCFKQEEHDEHDVVQFMVKKSQSELEEFYSKLERNYPATTLPALPRKSFLNEVSGQEMKISFEKFLQFLAMSSKLCTCPVLLDFFGSDPIKAGRFSRDNSRQESGDAIDIFEEARRESPSPVKHHAGKRPSIFDDDDDDKFQTDLFPQPLNQAPSGGQKPEDEDEFDLLALAKAADRQARGGEEEKGAGDQEGAELSEETGEREGATNRFVVGSEPRLFDDDLDLEGGAVRKDDRSIFILPGSTLESQLADTRLDDNSDLLQINDDVDSLFQKPQKPKEKPKPAVKPKPPTKPKPDVKPKPAVKPKLKEKSAAIPDISGSDDIMKYIRENTVDNDDVDLFS